MRPLTSYRIARGKEKRLETVTNDGYLFHTLTQRLHTQIKDIDERLDIMAKFSQVESAAYLRRKQETRSLYETQLARYAKESHKRLAATRKSGKNNAYLLYADRVVSKFTT